MNGASKEEDSGNNLNGTVIQDAGTLARNHYKARLGWRHPLREAILPMLRWETPFLVQIQRYLRNPVLDAYFLWTANLGTHTFYMVSLPIVCPFLIWRVYANASCFGRIILVDILSFGVFFSGMLKDALCLPRPLSPPLQRITMSAQPALEYGFPSTHTTNAVSVGLLLLSSIEEITSQRLDSVATATIATGAKVFAWVYMVSISFGRIYCGMHGVFDVVWGAILGTCIMWLRHTFGPSLDSLLGSGSVPAICATVLGTLLMIRLHPEPADPCPCFDDGVAFMAVFMGTKLAIWRTRNFESSNLMHVANGDQEVISSPFGIIFFLIRIIIGITVIFAWRACMKKLLHSILPPFYRFLEKVSLDQPRAFFEKASSYAILPRNLDETGTPFPTIQRVRSMIGHFKSHGRNRSVSVGPQSVGDVYDMIDYQADLRRRRRANSQTNNSSESGTKSATAGSDDVAVDEQPPDEDIWKSIAPIRVRYDVEVVTKLVCYCGIGWISMDYLSMLFDLFGV